MAFVIDVFARRIVGWRASSSMHNDFVLDALEHGSTSLKLSAGNFEGLGLKPQPARRLHNAPSRKVPAPELTS